MAQTLKQLDKWAVGWLIACSVTNYFAWQSSELRLQEKILVFLAFAGLILALYLFLCFDDELKRQGTLRQIFG